MDSILTLIKEVVDLRNQINDKYKEIRDKGVSIYESGENRLTEYLVSNDQFEKLFRDDPKVISEFGIGNKYVTKSRKIGEMAIIKCNLNINHNTPLI